MTDSYGTASGYDRLALIIGNMSLQWTNIEHLVHDICLHYAACVDEAFEGDRRAYDVLHVALAAMDMRQTVTVAKTLIFMASNTTAPDLYERAEALLNYVDNQLRPERNRFIHDIWSRSSEGLENGPHGFSRYQLGPRVFSPQSRTRAYGTFTERHFAEVSDLEKFNEALDAAYVDLVVLDNYTGAVISAQKAPSEELPPPPPAEWQSLGHRGWQGRGTPRPRD